MKYIYLLLVLFLFSSGKSFAQYNHVVVFFSQAQNDSIAQQLSGYYDQHLDYINKLKKSNKITAYGIFENGEGVVLFPNSDIDSVRAMVSKDPTINAGLFRAEYFHTNLRYGNFCPGEEEEMEKFNFVQYTSHITKYNVMHVPQLLKMHDDYLKEITATGNVAAEGVFSNSDGGFLIIRGDLAEEVIMNDPTYQAGFTLPDIRNIYLPKGSFCN